MRASNAQVSRQKQNLRFETEPWTTEVSSKASMTVSTPSRALSEKISTKTGLQRKLNPATLWRSDLHSRPSAKQATIHSREFEDNPTS
jgi:hypothetical protein